MRLIVTGSLIAMIAALCGCLDYEEELALEADGTGTIRMRISMEEQQALLATMILGETTQYEGEDSSAEAGAGMFARTNIEKSLRLRKSRAQLVSYAFSDEADRWVWDITFSFGHVDDIAQIAASLFPTGMIPTEDSSGAVRELPPMVIFADQDSGSWLFTRPLATEQRFGALPEGYDGDYDEYLPDSVSASDYESEVSDGEDTARPQTDSTWDSALVYEETMTDMIAELAQYRIRFSVTFPGEIAESNADSVFGKSAVWVFPMSELVSGMPDLRAVIRK